MKNLGSLKYFLGIEVARSSKAVVGKSVETGEGCEICYRAKQTWDSFLKVIIKRMVFLI